MEDEENHVAGEKNPTVHTALLVPSSSTYHDGCPGCMLDRSKATSQGTTPYKQLSLVALLALSNVLPICSLFSYVYFMVRDLGIAKSATQIGTYSGFLGSAMLLGRFLTSTPWGMVADSFGHIPVICLGTTSIVVFNTLFGFSTNYWIALMARLLLGIGNGMSGTLTAYASEICRQEHQAFAMSVIGTMWGVGSIIGPAIGGYLAQETVHKHGEKGGNLSNKKYVDANNEAEVMPHENYLAEVSINEMLGKKKSLWRNQGVVATITVISFWVLHAMSYNEIFSLWAVSPETYGGLDFTSSQVADVLAMSGAAILIFQLSVFPLIANALGPIQVIRASTVLSTILIATYPLFHRLQGKALWVVLILASIAKNILSGKEQRGVANGAFASFMSAFQAIGPTLAGIVFSWSEERTDASFLPGMWMMFSLLGVFSFLPFFATMVLPTSINNPVVEA